MSRENNFQQMRVHFPPHDMDDAHLRRCLVKAFLSQLAERGRVPRRGLRGEGRVKVECRIEPDRLGVYLTAHCWSRYVGPKRAKQWVKKNATSF